SARRFAAPLPYRLDRLFIQAQSRALDDSDICHAVVRFDNRFDDHDALILRLPRLFRVRWIRLVVALRDAHAVHSRSKRSAACTAAFARPKTSAGPASNTGPVTMAQSIGSPARQRVTNC